MSCRRAAVAFVLQRYHGPDKKRWTRRTISTTTHRTKTATVAAKPIIAAAAASQESVGSPIRTKAQRMGASTSSKMTNLGTG
jgi:hypothetical protein